MAGTWRQAWPGESVGEEVEERLRWATPELNVKEERDRFTVRTPTLSGLMDKEANLLIARPREAERLRQGTDPAIRLGDWLRRVIELPDRGEEAWIHARSLMCHRRESLRRTDARHCSDSARKHAK